MPTRPLSPRPRLVVASAMLFLALAALPAAGCRRAPAEFEGKVTMALSKPGAPPAEMLFETARGHVRLVTRAPGNAKDAPSAYVLVRPDGMAVIVSEADRAYSDLSMNKARAAMAADNAGAAPEAKATGRKETIAGQECEIWNIGQGSGKWTEACIAEGFIGFDFASLMPGGGPMGPSTDEVKKRKLFPLRSIEKDASGKELSRMTVTAIERTPLDVARFEVPKDYAYAKK